MPRGLLGVGELAKLVADVCRGDMERDVVLAVVDEERRSVRQKLVRTILGENAGHGRTRHGTA